MKCPIDKTELKVVQRQGVEIDICPHCHGVWLDRGELDKILDAAYALPDTAPIGANPPTVGVWADSIPQAPTPQNQVPPPPQIPTQAAPSQQAPDTTQPNAGPLGAGANSMSPLIPALGGLLAGLAAGQMNQGHYRHGKRRKPRGWLEHMFDIDLD